MAYSKPLLTNEHILSYNHIEVLQKLISDGTLTSSEMAQYIDMTKKEKSKLVRAIYFKDKRKKEFYTCKDGRVKSYNPQFIAPSEEALIDKLYEYYFKTTLTDVYKEWVAHRAKIGKVSCKTIEEDIGIWNRLISKTAIAEMPIDEIKPRHIMQVFETWTGDGTLITRKAFNNRKSVLNGIFCYAVLHEQTPNNPVASLPCNDLKFKAPSAEKKAYTIEERRKLLAYLSTLEPDAYILAIMLAFYGILRIGEIKGLSWTYEEGNVITIQNQLVEEREVQSDLTLSSPRRRLKDPKGNPNYSIRTEVVSDKGKEILTTMRKLNPNGNLLFMYEGRPLTTDTFNSRLKKYCDIVGIPYLSSHKIRFTGASILYDSGVKAIDIQPLLGHSKLNMTEHYIGQRVRPIDTKQMSQVLI